MAQVYVSIGSNIDAEQHVRAAVRELTKHYGELSLSRVYESAAVGFAGDNFLNLVAGFATEHSAAQVIDSLHAIENQYGRERGGPRFSSRTLDIDLLLYDDLVLQDQGLDVPRGEIIKNAFVLQPLAEIAPHFNHPQQQRSIQELWQHFDKSSQSLWPIDFEW